MQTSAEAKGKGGRLREKLSEASEPDSAEAVPVNHVGLEQLNSSSASCSQPYVTPLCLTAGQSGGERQKKATQRRSCQRHLSLKMTTKTLRTTPSQSSRSLRAARGHARHPQSSLPLLTAEARVQTLRSKLRRTRCAWSRSMACMCGGCCTNTGHEIQELDRSGQYATAGHAAADCLLKHLVWECRRTRL